jgi:predicted  nucleic acid-binding Zn ribbon protein
MRLCGCPKFATVVSVNQDDIFWFACDLRRLSSQLGW